MINYRETPNWDEEVRVLTDGRGVDCVVEIGGPGTNEYRRTRRRAGCSSQEANLQERDRLVEGETAEETETVADFLRNAVTDCIRPDEIGMFVRSPEEIGRGLRRGGRGRPW